MTQPPATRAGSPRRSAPWAALLPHATPRFSSRGLDTAFAVLPRLAAGQRALYVAAAPEPRFFLDLADFSAPDSAAGLYAATLPRRTAPGVVWSAATLDGLSGAPPADLPPLAAFALVVLSADLPPRATASEAWDRDAELLTAATGPDAGTGTGAGAALPAPVRWLARELAPEHTGAVLDYYTSESLERRGPARRNLPVAAAPAHGAACAVWWPRDTPAEARRAAIAAGAEAAGVVAHAAAWAAVAFRLGRGHFALPGWVAPQLGWVGFGNGSGVYVTLKDASRPGQRARCCVGLHQQAGGTLAEALDFALAMCVADLPPDTEAPEAPENVALTLLRPIASGAVVPAAGGPRDRPDALRWYAEAGRPSIGLGLVDPSPDVGTFAGVLFLPHVWEDNPAWSWADLVRRLRAKAEALRGTRFLHQPGVQLYLIPSLTVTARPEPVPGRFAVPRVPAVAPLDD